MESGTCFEVDGMFKEFLDIFLEDSIGSEIAVDFNGVLLSCGLD